MQQAKLNLISKVDKTHEYVEDLLTMMSDLSGKVDTSAVLIDENKAFIIEKLRAFQISITKELRQATEHLDLAAYEASFNKIEDDIVTVFQDVGGIKQQIFTEQDELRKWRHQMEIDLQLFYEKYDTRIQEAGLSDEER